MAQQAYQTARKRMRTSALLVRGDMSVDLRFAGQNSAKPGEKTRQDASIVSRLGSLSARHTAVRAFRQSIKHNRAGAMGETVREGAVPWF